MEQRLVKLEQEIWRLREERQISMLMSRHTVNHIQKNIHLHSTFFALDEEDVWVEVGDRGRYRGRAAVEFLFEKQWARAPVKGNLLLPFLTTEMIEIAADGNSAKGVWRVPSVQVVVPSEQTVKRGDASDDPQPIWLFGAYAVDFVRKGSEWKILHLHWFRTIKANYYDGWVKDESWNSAGPYQGNPTNQGSYHNPWRPEGVQDSIPPCPLPYATYDGPEWMTTDQAGLWKIA